MRIITLTTDFGHDDAYVGVMKGVILSIAPEARIVDLTHEIPPQNVMAGALAIDAAVDYFPHGTIHVGVIDPGVGSERKSVAMMTSREIFVGPDNGLFDLALQRRDVKSIVELTNTDYHLDDISSTFHGRDIFAPAAAHLASGIEIEALGPALPSHQKLELPRTMKVGSALEVPIVHVDHFGNLIANLSPREFDAWCNEHSSTPQLTFSVGSHSIHGLSRTFADVEVGMPVAYFGSSGRLEIAIRNGDAAHSLRVKVGNTIRIVVDDGASR